MRRIEDLAQWNAMPLSYILFDSIDTTKENLRLISLITLNSPIQLRCGVHFQTKNKKEKKEAAIVSRYPLYFTMT